MYSIKAVAQATGLTVETLRAWERRYGIVVPGRDAGGRRVYRPEDVLRLRRLREATERGHPIGRLATLGDEGLARLLNEAPGGRGQAVADAFVGRILESARRFRTAECEQVLTLAVAMLPPGQLVREVLHPLLHEVGDRWHRGEFAISQERLVSSVVRRHMGLLLESYERSASGGAIVFATLPGERHELGLLMAALVCASRGARVHYLGPELPAPEIARYAREVGARAVALSIVVNEQLSGLATQLRDLADALPPETALWIGGAASRELPAGALPASCALVRDAAELEQRLAMQAA